MWMKFRRWQAFLGLSLLALSAFLYIIQYLIFTDARSISYYFFQDLAFVPIEVLLVTIIINNLLERRGKRLLLKKLNMVIGAFFSEVGTGLVHTFLDFIPQPEEITKDLRVNGNWTRLNFEKATKNLRKMNYVIESKSGDLFALKSFLLDKRIFLLRLLENPNLLEHDSFTELLWAVFHLAEELDHRENLKDLPDPDFEHLSNDMKRACSLVIIEWLAYMFYLKNDYPYLFSLAVRTNPFDPAASVIFR
jgi:hypothetical protein